VENSPHHHKIGFTKIEAHLKGEKKLYVLLTAIFFVVLIIGFISPTLLQNKKEHWNSTLQEKLAAIRQNTISIFEKRQTNLLDAASELKKSIEQNKIIDETFPQNLFHDEAYSGFQIFLLDSLLSEAASNATIGLEGREILTTKNGFGTTYFHTSPLITLLCYNEQVKIQNKNYFLLVTSLFETSYNSENISQQNNFLSTLESEFESEVDVAYSPSKAITKDGRYFSFDLQNNKEQKIGLVTVAKPTLKAELKTFKENGNKIQSLFIVIGIVLLGFILRYETKEIKLNFIKPLLAVLYLALVRWIIFALNFPASLVTGELTNPNYFSSAFAGGIVKSPLEFLTTSLFFTAIVAVIYYASNFHLEDFFTSKYTHPVKRAVYGFFSLILLLLSIRGIAAAVKSVIFDSSLRYFDTVDIIPGAPHLVMHIAIFLVVLSGFALFQILLKIIYYSLPGDLKKSVRIVLIYFVLIACSIIFILAQRQPLLTFLMFGFASVLLATVFFLIELTKTKALKKILYLSFAASLLTISLMNFFNSELEKEELKRTALFLSRPQESYSNFLLNESLSKIVLNTTLDDFFLKEGTNQNALALELWLSSSFHNEKISSSLTLLDKRKKIVGYFSNGVPEEQLLPQIAVASLTKSLQIFDVSDKSKQWQKIFCGIIPIVERDEVVGFAAATIILTTRNVLSVNPVAAIFQQPEINLRSLNEKNFVVFLLAENKIYPINGTVFPSPHDINKLATFLTKENEGWISYDGASEIFLGYGVERMNSGSHPYLIVAQKETAFSFSLFNFFKLFIIHTSFLIVVLLLLFAMLSKGKLRLTFRSQLLIAFLLIAILPIIALAIYNRNSVEEKNIALIQNSLKEKANLAENYYRSKTAGAAPLNKQKVFVESSKDLLLSISIYENAKLAFSTQQNLFDASVLRKDISEVVESSLGKRGNGLFVRRFIGSREALSFYKPIMIKDETLFLEVNDYFNQIPVALNFVEVNVFLFGVYSFAIVLIVIISSFLADQISLPIRRLTRATRAVAHGDLNVSLKENSMGELKDLINGFNIMTDELRKNQKELAELEREQAWKEMARQVAHEIKNPLTPMKLTLQQLVAMYKNKSKNFDTLFEKVSETILAQIETLSQIASEFSSFGKMPPLNLASVNLKHALNEIVLLFNEENIALTLSYQAETELIEADASQVKRMFINLIRNAMQASAHKVAIAVEEDARNISVRISDDGKGIPESDIHKIFTSNFTTKTGGMGLGLKLAKKFVESINGDISVETTSANGTAFLVRFQKDFRKKNDAV